MKKLVVLLLAVVVLFSSVVPKQVASADGLTLAAIAGSAYAIASASGLNFSFTGYDGAGVAQWMQNRINSWLAGRTVAEAFGSEAIRLVAGKLLLPAAAVTGITAFLSDLISDSSLSENSSESTIIGVGTLNGQNVYPSFTVDSANLQKIALTPFVDGGTPSYGVPVDGTNSSGFQTHTVTAYNIDGTVNSTYTFTDTSTVHYTPGGYFLKQVSSNVQMYCVMVWYSSSGSKNFGTTSVVFRNAGSLITGGNVTAQIPGAYTPPEGLNDLQSWEGTVSDAPDTNLDDLLDDIFDQGAAGTLGVSGEVVDTPAEPQVTPVPTAAPGDVIGGLDTISGQLEGIDQTLTGVQEGVGEAVGQLEGINEGIGSISEALDVPTSSEAPAFKFDLTTLFPFCIPFDIYRFVTMFSASPVAPHVQIPFNIPAVGLQYTFDLDFSSFDGVASVLRSVELIAFCVGLAILTSKVIRW